MSLVEQVAELNGKVVTLVPQLEQNGLIFRVDGERSGTPADYAFNHALVQDTLYGSLLTPQRATLHQKAAEALEESYGDKSADVADVTDAGQVEEMYRQAREQCGRIDVLFNNAGISPTDDASVLDT